MDSNRRGGRGGAGRSWGRRKCNLVIVCEKRVHCSIKGKNIFPLKKNKTRASSYCWYSFSQAGHIEVILKTLTLSYSHVEWDGGCQRERASSDGRKSNPGPITVERKTVMLTWDGSPWRCLDRRGSSTPPCSLYIGARQFALPSDSSQHQASGSDRCPLLASWWTDSLVWSPLSPCPLFLEPWVWPFCW